mgnify:CR=1 FL=1
MKKKNVASMAMAAMMAAGALPMNAWAAPEVNHDETLTIEVYDVAANYQGMQTGWYANQGSFQHRVKHRCAAGIW